MGEKGQDLARMTFQPPDETKLVDDLQMEAFFEVYPKSRQLRGLFPQTVVFSSVKDMQTQERMDRQAVNKPIYQTVSSLLPRVRKGNKEEPDPKALAKLDEFYYFVSERAPFYTNFERDEIYIQQQVLADLRFGDRAKVLEASIRLGFRLIEENTRALAYKLNPQPIPMTGEFLWLPQFAAHVDEFYDVLEKAFSGKDRVRFRRSKPQVLRYFTKDGMTDANAHLVAVGAQVLYHHFGNPLSQVEDAVGATFDKGIMQILTSPVKKLFLTKIGEKLGANLTDNEVSSQTQISAQRICQILELEDEVLFDAYIHSLIPQLYMDSDAPEIDPSGYPKLIDPVRWIQLAL